MATKAGESTARDSVVAAARFIRRSLASSRASGQRIGSQQAQISALVEWAERNGEVVEASCLEKLSPIAEGAEHTVFYDRENARAVKATRNNRFGHSVRAEGASATVFEYLMRLHFHNLFFGDDIRIVGIIPDESNATLITSQPWINADTIRPIPTDYERYHYFQILGFYPIQIHSGVTMFYDDAKNILIADAEGNNVIRGEDRKLYPIDIVVGTPEAELLEKLRDKLFGERLGLEF